MKIAHFAISFLLIACAAGTDKPATQKDSASGAVAQTDSAAGSKAAGAQTPAAALSRSGITDTTIVRALYVNRWATQSKKRMRQMIGIADSTEINALVLDMKDEFGLNYESANPAFRKLAGTAGVVRDLKSVIDTMHAHGVFAIARIVVFKDSVAARANASWTIRQPDGSIWRDKKGLAWVNPYSRGLWDYNIGVAEELAKLGFDEIQFDYIRFPEPYKSLPTQVYADHGGVSKPENIKAFLAMARERLHKAGARSTADIFGLVTTVGGALEIGQEWEKVAPVTDALLPMVYPSHYPRGSFGVASPNADPYRIVNIAISRARERNEKLGVTVAEHVRPYLQAFTLGAPQYGAEQLNAQKQAVYDAGYDGWVLWAPGSQYDPYRAAFEKELVSRKKRGAERTPAGKVGE